MSLKLRGNITAPKFDTKNMGDVQITTGKIVFEWNRAENRGVAADEILDLSEHTECVITLDIYGEKQRELFDSQNAHARLADYESDPEVTKDKGVLKLIKQLRMDAEKGLTANEFTIRVDEIGNTIHPPQESEEKTDQRKRLEDLKFSEPANKIAVVQKALAKLEADDGNEALDDDALGKRLDKIDKLIKKHSVPPKAGENNTSSRTGLQGLAS